MKYRLPHFVFLVAIIGGVFPPSHAGVRHGSVESASESTLYTYLNDAGGWCALKDRTAFMAEVRSDKASQLDADQAQVWFKAGRLYKVTEFRMDADGEWSTTSTYKTDMGGNITSASVIVRSGEPATDKTFRFIVANGVYSPRTPRSFSPKTFRKATSAASFPYLGLVVKLGASKATEKLCTSSLDRGSRGQ